MKTELLTVGRFLSNIYDHRLPDAPDRLKYSDEACHDSNLREMEWQLHLDWVNSRVIGPPKGDEHYTTEKMIEMNYIGIYDHAYKIDPNQDHSVRDFLNAFTGVTMPDAMNSNFYYVVFDESRISFAISELGSDFQHLLGRTVFEKSWDEDGAWSTTRRVVEFSNMVVSYRLAKSGDPSYEAFLVGMVRRTTHENHQEILSSRLEAGAIC